MSLVDRILKGTIATFASSIVGLVTQAVILLALARVFLTSEEYGLLFLSISLFGMLSLFANAGLHRSAARYVSEYRETDSQQVRYVVRRSLTFNLLLIATVCAFMVAFSGQIAAVFDEPRLEPFVVLGVGYLALNAMYSYATTLLQGFGEIELSAVVGIVTSVATLAFILALLVAGFGAIGALVGFTAGYAVGVLVGFGFLFRLYRRCEPLERPADGLTRRLLEYSIPLTVTSTGNVIYKRVDTLLIGFFLSPLAVGYYELAKQVSAFVVTPAQSLGFSVAPIYGELKSTTSTERAARIYEQTFNHLVLLYLPAVAGIVVVAEPGIRYVFGEEFLGAVPVLQVLSVYVLFQAIDKITNDSLDYLGRARERAIGKGVTAALNLLLNLALIPTVGVVGAALSTSFTFGLMVLYNVYVINEELDVELRKMARFSGLAAVVAAGMAAVVFALLPYVTGLVTLALVIAAGILTWGSLSVASGLLDRRTIATYF